MQHYFIQQIILLLSISLTAATSVDSRFESFHFEEKKNLLRHRPFIGGIDLKDSVNVDLHGKEATVAPTVAPSANATTITPTPAPTVTPTTSPPTTAEPTTASPTTNPSSPTQHHKWWKIVKLVLKTVFWMLVAGLFFFAFGAAMSNRYRIYYYVRGLWYSFLRKLKSLRRRGQDGGAANSTLNDIIFSDNDLREGLLARDT